ncbi:hypothetical protein BH09BAC1_BH09BAC1_25830 [soil metagenome]
MKQIVLLLLIAGFGHISLFAQEINQVNDEAQVMNSRLKASRYRYWYANAWENGDSMVYKYTGNRGGSWPGRAEFDTAWTIVDGGATWFNRDLEVRTYDGSNRQLSSVSFEDIGSGLSESQKETNTYNTQGQVLENTNYTWNGTAWTISDRTIYTYDANGNELTYSYEFLNGASLQPYVKVTSTYNSNNNLETLKEEHYNGSTFDNYSRTTYTHSGNNVLTETHEKWLSGNWKLDSKVLYTYNGTSPNYLTRETQNHDGTTWVPNQRVTYTWNSFNESTLEIRERYVSGAWENYIKDAYIYDTNGNLTESINYDWVGGAWLEDERETYSYDANGNNLQESSYGWDNNAWVEYTRNYFRYNSFNQVVLDSSLVTGSPGLVNDGWEIFYYETYEDGTNSIVSINSLTSAVMPNPFTVNVAVQIKVAQAGNHTFEVYNIAGQLVHNEERNLSTGEQTIIWEGAEAPKGVYFYKINSASGVASGKLVKQ